MTVEANSAPNQFVPDVDTDDRCGSPATDTRPRDNSPRAGDSPSPRAGDSPSPRAGDSRRAGSNVPAADHAAPTSGLPADSAAAADAVRRLWRNTLWRAVGVPLVVLSPLIALAPSADQRFNIYWHGALFRDNPLGVFRHSFVTMTGVSNGNYRPLGRSLEKLLDVTAYLLTDQFGIPVTVSTRMVSFASAVVFTVLAVLCAEAVVARGRMFASPPSVVAAVVPFGVGGGLVAAGGASTTVLFAGLYLLSAALVMTVTVVACRFTTDGDASDGAARPNLGWAIGAVAVGAALAVVNEVAYLALPLAAAAVLVRARVVLALPWRAVSRTGGARLVALLWLGFLPVFLPVRLVIWRYCRDGDCYRGSDVALSADVLLALPTRLLAWLPPMQWRTATAGAGGTWLVALVAVGALLVLAVLVRSALGDLAALTTLDRRQGLGLAGVGFALLLLGSTLAALNADIQGFARQGRWGQGWRDSGLTTAGGWLAALGLCFAALAHRRWRYRATVALLILTALGATVSTAANKRHHDNAARRQTSQLTNRLGQEMADVDRSEHGNARRCALLAQIQTLYAGNAFVQRRYAESLEMATQQSAGVPFCRPVVR